MPYTLNGFDGKVAVVTGAGRMRSIGRGIAVALAEAGCDVVLTGTGRKPEDRPDDEKEAGWNDIQSVAEEVEAAGRRALPLVSNVADESAVARLTDDVMREFGRVDILINNAGARRGEDRTPVLDMDAAVWRNVIEVNLTGSFLMSKAFGRLMVDAGRGGSIVNISSIAGKHLPPNTAAYASSKAAIHALTVCMAQEVARAGVRVNSVCPGVVDTSRMDDLGRGEVWNEFIDRFVPIGRVGTPGDIAATVVYLCSDEGAWVTGQSWNVDGGSCVQH